MPNFDDNEHKFLTEDKLELNTDYINFRLGRINYHALNFELMRPSNVIDIHATLVDDAPEVKALGAGDE